MSFYGEIPNWAARAATEAAGQRPKRQAGALLDLLEGVKNNDDRVSEIPRISITTDEAPTQISGDTASSEAERSAE